MKLDLPRLGAEALDLAVEQGRDYHDVRECAWALLVDAMKTFASMPGDGPRGVGSCMPQTMPDHWESFGTVREQLSDGVARAPAARMPRIPPSARAVTRCHEVMLIWHPQTFRGFVRRPADVTRAMMLLACGSSMRRVGRLTGIPKGSLTHFRDITSRTVGRLVLPFLEEIAQAS